MDVVRFATYVPPLEMKSLHGDPPAVALFGVCGSPISLVQEIYANGIMGRKNYDSSGNSPEYRLGYCAIEFDGPFAVAKTFLPP